MDTADSEPALLETQALTPMALILMDGKGGPRAVELGPRVQTTIGREAGCELVIQDQRVSRKHAIVELVEGQHLLRDLGSSNGTFLNGLRLSAGHAFALREGDVVEIGNDRLVYARTVEAALSPVATEGEACSYPLADLVRDGYQQLDAAERTELQVSIQRVFDGVPRPVALERSLAIVAERLSVRTAVLFIADARKSLRPIVVRPRIESAGEALKELAARAWSTREGRLHVWGCASEVSAFGETGVYGETSAAATPFQAGLSTGAIAIERVGGRRLDRSDLALLAAFAERISQTLALRAADADDTRVGFGG
jgi:hypothetical protein